MTTENASNINSSKARKNHCSRSGQSNWSPANTAAMVLGFIFFWPIGLFLLYWNISGRDIRHLPGAMRNAWHQVRGDFRGMNPFDSGSGGLTDNVVFNEYQQTQFDRISEIQTEIRTRKDRFTRYREDAKRRADEEEFSRFMASAPVAGER